MKYIFLVCFFIAFQVSKAAPYVLILGIAQDGGYPHAGCSKECCAKAWKNDKLQKYVVSFALVDSISHKWWLFEATPDIKFQLQYFKELTQGKFKLLPEGIFLTHAHIGHYTGLMELGREVMNTKEVAVYALPKMATFLETNGPWSQLVKLQNIRIQPLKEDSVLVLTESIKITAFRVPHRDEYSETAGYKIEAGSTKYLFIPDIDKWGKWDRNIIKEVQAVDYALLDATFFREKELPERKISEVPHPFVSETMELFKNEILATKAKIYFIHFNHTNPLLWDEAIQKGLMSKGFHLARQGERFN